MQAIARQNAELWEQIVQRLESSTRQLLQATGAGRDAIDNALAARSSSIQQLIVHATSFRELSKESQAELFGRANKAFEIGALAVESLEGLKHSALREWDRGRTLSRALAEQSGVEDDHRLELAG